MSLPIGTVPCQALSQSKKLHALLVICHSLGMTPWSDHAGFISYEFRHIWSAQPKKYSIRVEICDYVASIQINSLNKKPFFEPACSLDEAIKILESLR